MPNFRSFHQALAAIVDLGAVVVPRMQCGASVQSSIPNSDRVLGRRHCHLDGSGSTIAPFFAIEHSRSRRIYGLHVRNSMDLLFT